MTSRTTKVQVAAAGVVLAALVIVPAPLLPPHRLAEAAQALLGVGWKAAYLLAAVGLQFCFYSSLGVLAAFAGTRALTLRGRLLQMAVLPLVVAGLAVLIRCAKLGHWPMLANALVPIAACLLGVGLGLGLLYRGWKVTLLVALGVFGAAGWGLLGSNSAELSRDTEASLRRLVAAGPSLPSGQARFGALWQTAFAPMPAHSRPATSIQHNRAAILALGIAIGHERLARFAGLDPKSDLVRQSVSLRAGTTLRGRDDWPRHYALSAGIAVLEHPLVSDAGGLIKEQLDALTQGSGFSFGDLAADRAGVRFAIAATQSEAAAKATQGRLQAGFRVEDFFPPASDLPENLTVAQFRSAYGGVGSPRYRQATSQIEARLDLCPGLVPYSH
jgi:hypothetical protein